MDFAGYLALILALSITVTKSVDLIRNALDPGARAPKVLWNVAAFGVGIAYCLGFGVDVITPGLQLVPATADVKIGSTVAELLSGFILGGAAGFWHEALDALSAKGTPKPPPSS